VIGRVIGGLTALLILSGVLAALLAVFFVRKWSNS